LEALVKRLVHNLGGGFDRAIVAGLPQGWVTEVLDPGARWSLPGDADAAFLAHGTLDDPAWKAAPRPEGWPGRTMLVQLASTGLQGYPEWLFEAAHVASARGTNAPPIAEYVLAAMLVHEKRVPELWVHDDRSWPERGKEARWQLGTLDGKVLGLVGVGAIGSRIAALAQPFGMRVVAARRSGSAAGIAGIEVMTLDDVLPLADHLVVAAPLTLETIGLIGAEQFARLKPGAHLVNVARGAIVDHEALLAALEAGQVSAATLDVTEPEPLPAGHPLYSHPRVRISPHISWNAPGLAQRLLALLGDNLRQVAGGEPPVNRVTLADYRAEADAFARTSEG
jgi:phosphoglycerate dehydrogenase-like enzyme